MVKLWENASPTSTFPEQTIEIDYSMYDLLMIVVQNFPNTDSNNAGPSREVGALFNPSLDKEFYLRTQTTALSNRKVSVVDNGLSFSNGSYYMGSKLNTSLYDCIPIRVYGLRGIA